MHLQPCRNSNKVPGHLNPVFGGVLHWAVIATFGDSDLAVGLFCACRRQADSVWGGSAVVGIAARTTIQEEQAEL